MKDRKFKELKGYLLIMNELNLVEIKKIAFDILKHFKRFCEEKNIRYCLSNGTLLGAIKYKGFIPWDDDIDVFVPREDYEKLIAIYKDSEQYKLFSMERNNDYRYTFAKLCDMSTCKMEENINNGIELGVDIDIFPLDSVTAHVFKRRIINEIKIYHLAFMLSKFKTSYGKSIYKRLIIEYCKYKGFKYFGNKIIKIADRERRMGNGYKGCIVWPIYGEKEFVSSDVFLEMVEVEFEGEFFAAPIGYDKYLRSLYGDYENDPPLEKQKTHHKFKAYKKNQKKGYV